MRSNELVGKRVRYRSEEGVVVRLLGDPRGTPGMAWKLIVELSGPSATPSRQISLYEFEWDELEGLMGEG